MELIPAYIISDAFLNSELYITQENDDYTKIFFELSYRPDAKIYICLKMSSKVNKTFDIVYECIYDQFRHKIHAPQEYPDNPATIIEECMEILTQNRHAINTHIKGNPFFAHNKEMRNKWFKEVMLETFGKILYDAKVKNMTMSI